MSECNNLLILAHLVENTSINLYGRTMAQNQKKIMSHCMKGGGKGMRDGSRDLFCESIQWLINIKAISWN